MTNPELTQQRLEAREQYRRRLEDIIAGRAIIEVIQDHRNILTRVQREVGETDNEH